MKKVIRKIIVDEIPFFWRVAETEADWGKVRIRVWFREGRNFPAFEVRRDSNTSWLWAGSTVAERKKREEIGQGAVTPKEVASLIKVIRQDYSLLPDHDKTLNFRKDPDGRLVLM